MRIFLIATLCLVAAQLASSPAWSSDEGLPKTRWAETRFPPGAESVPLADDSEAARQTAIARLRAASAREVCRGDQTPGLHPYGTVCASREFAAPPLLEAPKFRWQTNYGWWGAWQPILIGDRLLTGSCNNEDNKGLSALDARNGKILWRVAKICEEGGRGGTTGHAAFYPLGPDTVLFIHAWDDGSGRADYNVVDVRTGKFLSKLKPAKRGPTRQLDGLFAVLTHSAKEQTSYLNGLSPEMDRIVWRHDNIRYSCDDMDPDCLPVFSAAAGYDGILLQSIQDKDQPDPFTRRLHAYDMQSGKLLWKHVEQPVWKKGKKPDPDKVWRVKEFRSDDGPPLVADGKVIIKVGGLLGTNSTAGDYSSFALRALDPRNGAILWTTASIPTSFKQHWSADNDVTNQQFGNRIGVGGMLVVEIKGYGKAKELWGYRLADGQLMWRRSVPHLSVLTASAGGVFYLAENLRDDSGEWLRLEGLDGLTGTRLWSTMLPAHNLPFTLNWGIAEIPSRFLPDWRIGRDGALYGITLKGAYKLQ